jgi:hypothetical protein
MSDDGQTHAAIGHGDDAGGASGAGASGGADGAEATSVDVSGTTPYPAETLDLGGGTSDGDTPSTDDGG